MKKKITAFLLALCFVLTFPAAQAAEEPGFVRQRTYNGEFSDLAAGSGFYDNVAALYEYGLANGKTDGTFGLQDPLTVGQVVIFAGRVRSLYQTGDPESGPNAYGGDGGPAALAYLRYLQAEGVLGPELEGLLSESAARAQVAHVLNRVLPEEALPIVPDELVTQGYASRRCITDVTEYTPYYQDILDLYRKAASPPETTPPGASCLTPPLPGGPPPLCSPGWWTPPCGSGLSGICPASTAPPEPLWQVWWSRGPTIPPPLPGRRSKAPSAICSPRAATSWLLTIPTSPSPWSSR